jgi:hypothetical protein
MWNTLPGRHHQVEHRRHGADHDQRDDEGRPAGAAEQRRRGGQSQGILFRAHASALRPFIAKMPCGRFWMKMMMNTSTGDLGQHRAGPAFEQLVQDAQAQAAYTVPAS